MTAIPFVSIVMPLYNKEAELDRAIKSVLSQTIRDFELIVVNDGSTDKGPDLVIAIKDPRIKVIDQANAGVSAARNRGIKEARSDLIAFLDADDEWTSDFLEIILHLRKQFPACEVFATNYIFRKKNNYSRPTIIRGLSHGFDEGLLNDYFKIASQSDPPLCSSAIAVTKKAIETVGGFSVGVAAGEDLLTWALLSIDYEIAYSTRQCAIHWGPETVSDRPSRVPQIPDIVGRELARLMHETESSKVAGLKEYIALWHRMRGIVFMQMGERDNALHEFGAALKYVPTLKLYTLVLFAHMPLNISSKILLILKRIKRACS